jgi:hypothetical protein
MVNESAYLTGGRDRSASTNTRNGVVAQDGVYGIPTIGVPPNVDTCIHQILA